MVLSTAPTRIHVAKSVESILSAADAGEPGIERALLAALQALHVPNLEDLLAAGNLDATLAAVAATQIPPDDLDIIASLIAAIGVNVARPEAVTFGVEFNEVNRRTIRWAQQNVATNIVGVSPANVAVIRDTIVQSLELGVGPRVTASHIQDLIGLTPGHEKAVNRLYLKSLEDGVTEAHARKIAARKAAKLIRWRAEMIARTETIRAANMGQQLVWETALDEGLLPQGTKKVWNTALDDRVCPICQPLHGTTVGITSSFTVKTSTSPKVATTKAEKTPPAHFQCRCSMILERL